MAVPEQNTTENVNFDWSTNEFRTHEKKYNDIDMPHFTKWSQGLACSLNYFAYCTSETEIGILPANITEGSDQVKQKGRAAGYGAMTLAAKKPIYNLGDNAPVTDFVFDAFNPNLLFSGHDSGSLKCWTLSGEPLTENLTGPTWGLEGLCGSYINRLTVSDIVSNLLVASGKGSIAIVNTEAQEVVKTWDAPDSNEHLLDCDWDLMGSTLKVCSGSKSVYSFDPRMEAAFSTIDIRFEPSRVIHINKDGAFLLLGTDSFGRSLYQVFDGRSTRALVNQRIPKFSGIQIAEFDPMTKLLYLGCRQQTGVSMYDADAPLKGKKEMTKLLHENLPNVNIGWCSSPKKCLTKKEIHRLNVMTEHQIIPMSTVTKAKMLENNRDLTPSLSFNDWHSGSNSVRNEMVDLIHNATVVKKAKKSQLMNTNVVEVAKLNHKNLYENLKVSRTSVNAAYNIRANQDYILYNGHTTSLGVVGVCKRSEVGTRQNPKSRFRYHTGGVTSFDISPFVTNEVVTCGHDGQVAIWHIPAEGFGNSDITEPDHLIEDNYYKVQFVRFHPYIPQVLIIADSEMCADEAQNRIRLINMNTWQTTHEFDIPAEIATTVITDLDFNLRATHVAVSTSEKKVFIISLRSGIEHEFAPEESNRIIQVRWVDDNHILTIGFKNWHGDAVRCFTIWDIDEEQAGLSMVVDKENAIPIVHVDLYHKLVYFSGYGQRRIRIYELLENEIYPHMGSHLSWDDVCGWCFTPKQFLDVSKTEINHLWKVSKSTIVPISYQLMRKRKEYFQDDVYVPVLKAIPAMLNIEDWLSGTDVPDQRSSLQPENMIALSIAPEEQLTMRQQKRIQNVESTKKSKIADKDTKETAKELLDKISRIDQDKFAPDIGQWTVEAIGTEVDSDEWSS